MPRKSSEESPVITFKMQDPEEAKKIKKMLLEIAEYEDRNMKQQLITLIKQAHRRIFGEKKDE